MQNAGLVHQMSITARNDNLSNMMMAANSTKTAASAGLSYEMSKAMFDEQAPLGGRQNSNICGVRKSFAAYSSVRYDCMDAMPKDQCTLLYYSFKYNRIC